MKISRLDRLDAAVAAMVAVLVLIIGLVVLRGDQIGIAVQSFGPKNSGSSRAPIRVMFDEPITTANAIISLVPPVQGQVMVSKNQLSFLPSQPLVQGQEYTVTVRAG